jgi:hypothetical protein
MITCYLTRAGILKSLWGLGTDEEEVDVVPDPAHHFDADLDPCLQIKAQILEKELK